MQENEEKKDGRNDTRLTSGTLTDIGCIEEKWCAFLEEVLREI